MKNEKHNLTEGFTSLRVLAPKSVMKFGKYADMMLGEVMKFDTEYLVWLYYNASCISYRQDVIDELGIIPIEKPGTSKETHREWKVKLYQSMREGATNEQYMGKISHRRAVIRRKCKRRVAKANFETSPSRGVMQALNHGKI